MEPSRAAPLPLFLGESNKAIEAVLMAHTAGIYPAERQIMLGKVINTIVDGDSAGNSLLK